MIKILKKPTESELCKNDLRLYTINCELSCPTERQRILNYY